MFPENTIFIVFQRNTAVAIQTLYVNKKQKIDGNKWVVFEHDKRVFFLFVSFSGFNVIVFFLW